MKRMTALVAMLLCVVLAFGSCSITIGNMSFEKLYKNYKYEDETTVLTQKSELKDIDELIYQDNSTLELIAFKNSDGEKIKIYNAKMGSVVLTLTSKYVETYRMTEVYGVPFLIAVEKDENKEDVYYTSIYDSHGNKVAKKNGIVDVSDIANIISYKCDLFKFDNALYRVNEDGTIATVTSNPFATSIEHINTKTASYYYDINTADVSVYDQDLNCIYYWEVPFNNVASSKIFVLSDGVLVAQASSRLPDDAKKYDYVLNNSKYGITSYVLDVEKGKDKEVNLNFRISSVAYLGECLPYGNDANNYYPEKVENVALIAYIKDHDVASDTTAVTLNINNGSVSFELAPEFENVPVPYAEGKWIYTRDNGEEYIIDAKGEIVSKYSDDMDWSKNSNFIVINDKIYDLGLELVYDAANNDKVVSRVLNHTVILKDAKPDDLGKYEYYICSADGSVKKIDNYSSSRDQFYTTYNKDTKEYTFYNENGAELLKVKGSWSVVYTSNNEDVVIIRVYDSSNKYHYYKLFA